MQENFLPPLPRDCSLLNLLLISHLLGISIIFRNHILYVSPWYFLFSPYVRLFLWSSQSAELWPPLLQVPLLSQTTVISIPVIPTMPSTCCEGQKQSEWFSLCCPDFLPNFQMHQGCISVFLHPAKPYSALLSFYLGSGTQTPVPFTRNLSSHDTTSVKELENLHNKSSYCL